MKSCEPIEGIKIERRERRRRERACFWSWPFGHCMHWKRSEWNLLDYVGECCGCGKTKVNLAPYGARVVPLHKETK